MRECHLQSSKHSSSNSLSTVVMNLRSLTFASSTNEYNWKFTEKPHRDEKVQSLPLKSIRRPLQKTRTNDQRKVEALMESIAEIGLQEPIDVLEVEGKFYGFSGCHRFEACQRLDMETIDCRVRKATQATLKKHMS